jgi:hypothetical protein
VTFAPGCALFRFGAGRADARSGTGTRADGGAAAGPASGDATGGEAVCRADINGLAAARLALTGRTSAWGDSSAAACSTSALDRASAGASFAFFGRARGGCLCHTRAVTRMSSFSANGAIRHQVRGSAMYRSCELTNSGKRLLSMTGRVVSQVSTPGGNTYSHTKLWLNGNPIAIRKTTYGTVIPVKTPIQVMGKGAGSRKS